MVITTSTFLMYIICNPGIHKSWHRSMNFEIAERAQTFTDLYKNPIIAFSSGYQKTCSPTVDEQWFWFWVTNYRTTAPLASNFNNNLLLFGADKMGSSNESFTSLKFPFIIDASTALGRVNWITNHTWVRNMVIWE